MRQKPKETLFTVYCVYEWSERGSETVSDRELVGEYRKLEDRNECSVSVCYSVCKVKVVRHCR